MKKEKLITIISATAVTVVVAAALVRQWRRKRERQWKQTKQILKDFAVGCATPVSKLWEVADALVFDMQSSLADSLETSGESSITMAVSYVASLPSGDEKGLYYGLNLRGDTFLILCGRLGGNDEPLSDIHREEITIPPNVRQSTAEEIYDYIAVEMAKFISLHPDDGNEEAYKEKKLGVTMSYPVDPEDGATSWSAIRRKSFSTDEPIGKEIVNEINQALKKHGVHMKVYALVDAPIGDLAGGRYYSKDSVATITVENGTNATYIDAPESVPDWQWHTLKPKSKEIVISMEWGNFNSSHLPMTEFDMSLDSESLDPGFQIFERLISGIYLGEIVRRMLLKMAQETSLFGVIVPPKLRIPYQLRSPDMAAMHQDTSENHEIVQEKLNEVFGIISSTTMERKIVVEVCEVVAERGARLAGAGVVAILKKLGRIESRRSVVTVGGGLYEHYRVFRNYLHSTVWEMLGNDVSENVIIEHPRGGPGCGALFLAAAQTHRS